MNMRVWRCAVAVVMTVFFGASAAAPEDVGAETAAYEETASIGTTDDLRFENLSTFCMNGEGNLLACDAKKMVIRVVSSEGKLLDTWKLPLKPACIHSSADGTIYVGGTGELAKLDKSGKVLKVVKAAEGDFPNSKVSGIATTEKDLFIGFGTPGTLRSVSTLVRFDRDFGQPAVIAERLRGCCQRLDLIAKDDVLYVAENARHRVVKYDRTGKVLGTWGERSRKGLEGFGSCCNPMNLCFGPEGLLYTAESGMGRVKRYTPDGKFEGLVGYVGVARFNTAGGLAAACSNISVAVSKDAKRVYVLDYKANLIRVLTKK
jgi:hypothetical protein